MRTRVVDPSRGLAFDRIFGALLAAVVVAYVVVAEPLQRLAERRRHSSDFRSVSR